MKITIIKITIASRKKYEGNYGLICPIEILSINIIIIIVIVNVIVIVFNIINIQM